MFRVAARLALFWLVLINAAPVWADAAGAFPGTRIDLIQFSYSGEKGASFAEAGTAYGIGVSAFSDAKYLAPIFGLRFGVLSGRQVFLDGTTEVTAPFSYYGSSANLGLQIYPIGRRTPGINVYLSASGTVGYNFVSISKSATLSEIPYSDQAVSLGYVVGIGSEWILAEGGRNKWSINGEALYRKSTASLFNRQFDLSSFELAVGISW